jgi:predicted NAD-dependent protein-ADP-ribosyltransferase YbiA (DUF1768 family)
MGTRVWVRRRVVSTRWRIEMTYSGGQRSVCVGEYMTRREARAAKREIVAARLSAEHKQYARRNYQIVKARVVVEFQVRKYRVL